jgi:hypothetical protein
MPKVTGTRKQKATELLARLQRGPSFCYKDFGAVPTEEMVSQDTHCWLDTWIIPVVKELIPELKKPKETSRG